MLLPSPHHPTHTQCCAQVRGHHSICCFSKVAMASLCVFIKIQPEITGCMYTILKSSSPWLSVFCQSFFTSNMISEALAVCLGSLRYWKIKAFPIRHFPEGMAWWDSSPHILYSSTSHTCENKSRRGGTMRACSLGGAAFLPVVLGILSELMDSRKLKSGSIIGAVWDHQDRERNKGQPESEEELWEVLKEAKYNIPEDYWRKLQDSLPKRVQDVQRMVTEILTFEAILLKKYCVL